ncbi:MAG: hypothetical protein Q9213_008263 [Squamulea squamosa]
MFGAEFRNALWAEMQTRQRKITLPFDYFPQEIKNQVLSYAGIQDLKNVRLVSHNMAETAAAFLLNELLLTPWTLGRFRDKRSLQTVHPHVRDLVFYDVVLPTVTLDEWMDINPSHMSPSWPPHETSTRFNQYQILHDQQERNIKEFRGGEVIGGLFDQIKHTLRSLRGLTVASDDYGSWPFNLQTIKYRSLYDWSKVWHDICCLGLEDTEQQAIDIIPACLGFIVNNIVQSHTQLTSLAVGNIPYSFQAFLGNLGVGRSPPAIALFRSLVCFNLDLKFGSQIGVQGSSLKLLGECLSAANSLEHLHLGIRIRESYNWHIHADVHLTPYPEIKNFATIPNSYDGNIVSVAAGKTLRNSGDIGGLRSFVGR